MKFLRAIFFLFTLTLALPSPGQSPEPCRDLQIQLPPPSTQAGSRSPYFNQDTFLLILQALLPATEILVPNLQNQIIIACGKVSANAHAAIRASLNPQNEIDRSIFYNKMAPFYAAESPALWHPEANLNGSLQDFMQNFDFRTWNRRIIARSRVKNRTRVIYSSPLGQSPEVEVAQTNESETGDSTRPVRETEIIIKRAHNSSQWDFYVYDDGGRRSSVSHFPAGPRLAPSVCLGCHYDGGARVFGPRLP